MKRIAVSQRTQFQSDYLETRDSLDQRWQSFLLACKLLPFIIPNHPINTQKLLRTYPIDGVLLTGGNDSPLRMQTETLLLDYAIANGLPVLGVCHGMQRIQQYFGLTLKPTPGHVADQMEITIQQSRATVNSYHQLGTQETTSDLEVWARADDKTIKAIKHRHLPIMGVMWHPERYHTPNQHDIDLFHTLFSGELTCVPSY